MGGRFFHDVINHNVWLSDSMAAVFSYPHSLAVGRAPTKNLKVVETEQKFMGLFLYQALILTAPS